MYSIKIENRCLRELKKLDKPALKKAFNIIKNKIAKNPFKGKQLTGKYKGLYSYRFSSYRIIYEIYKKEITILILRVRHKKDIYDGL